MLKALELHGFKSFADKTRFEFPDGITVVVGPNGSGKSNVVDGIRWVLGEQSAKSLRGTEMADVIFKGSGTGQRRPANTAEVTIFFDNSTGLLGIEGDEVRVARRVYRSGEGEYLINDEPCRLRDIRDLFRGTGVGADAYSLIEQGKVDTLLQASPRERRAIFEEAAGISRFKAKKVEATRRLDRVEQNLLRLSDIVEEVDRRLKSLRNQATKAQRYKEYNDRLKELRTHVGMTDFRQISAEFTLIDSQISQADSERIRLEDENSSAERDIAALDERLQQVKTEARSTGQRFAKVRESIHGHESTSDLQRKTLGELEDEQQSCLRKLSVVNSRAGDMQAELKRVTQDLAEAESQYSAALEKAEAESTQLQTLQAEIQAGRDAAKQQRQQHAEQLSSVSKLTQKLNSFESELNLASNAIEREQQRDRQLEEQVSKAREQAKSTQSLEAQYRAKLDDATRELEAAQTQIDSRAAETAELQRQLAERQQQLTAASERSNVLEEVERRLEGIGAGTKDLLAQSKLNPVGALSEVRGMVADLVEVKVEMAPLIDAALGERAQYVVVTGQRLIRALGDDSVRVRGRVGLISLAMLSHRRPPLDQGLAKEEAVMGVATDFVQVGEPWRELASHLLGTTWFVRSLESAILLREKYKRIAWRFVTPSGEVLEADGTMFGGPRLSSGGIVSRRSELRSLRSVIQKYTEETNILDQKVRQRRETQTQYEQQLRKWVQSRKEASDEYAEAHAKAEAARQLVDQYSQNYESVRAGLNELRTQHDQLSQQQMAALSGLGELETLVGALSKALSEHQSQVAKLEGERMSKEQAANDGKVDLAKLEQRVETLRMHATRCQQDNAERATAVAEIRQQLKQCGARQDDTRRAILNATAQLAEDYWTMQSADGLLGGFRREESQIEQQRASIFSASKFVREQLQTTQQSLNALQLQAGELRMKRDAVVERVRDDYGIELADVHHEQEAPAEQAQGEQSQGEQDELGAQEEQGEQEERENIDREIGELRRKLSNIGAVNMESLAELEELDERFGALSTQYQDLIQAKESIERIIQRINVDSRRMFVETLDTIRESFQGLFQRAFGGGHADIVVEEGIDVLDAGIDIVATPPGKHSLNISLLSGGERALTAVTLLLAIFRHRPSPFCILDEVDGPLDEANIGRFVDVLKEFLRTTKVVIVTHSKKTMSAATTLYGVTMQESGVSKRVSVQFNDVSEDGNIRAGAGEDSSSDDGEAA